MGRDDSEKPIHEFYDGELTVSAKSATFVENDVVDQLYVLDPDFEDGGLYRSYDAETDIDKDGVLLVSLALVGRLISHSDWDLTGILALTSLHEYCHWALTPEENEPLRGDSEHSYRWNSLLVEQLEYVTGRDLPRSSLDPENADRT